MKTPQQEPTSDQPIAHIHQAHIPTGEGDSNPTLEDFVRVVRSQTWMVFPRRRSLHHSEDDDGADD